MAKFYSPIYVLTSGFFLVALFGVNNAQQSLPWVRDESCDIIETCIGGSLTITNPMTRVGGIAEESGHSVCEIKIPKQPHICQVRVDFLNFTVGSADFEGICPNDFVLFKGATNFPSGFNLCGGATDQHLYLHYAKGDSCAISIIANLETLGSFYDLKITMIDCLSPLKAPEGCTQYFNTPQNIVQSFNYPNQQLSSQKYSVCVGGEGQSITWKPCTTFVPTFQSPFFVSGNIIAPPGPLRGSDKCTTDYIMIPPNNIMCGSNFTDSLISSATPYILFVNFDDTEFPEIPALNPETGCPLGFNCTAPILPCQYSDSCEAPHFMTDLLDVGNTGFCLNYILS